MQTYTHYKDSGIDWIGQIPEHWEVCKNKFINKIYNGDSLNENQKKKYESEDINELPYISSKDINLDYSTINYENGLRISDSQNFKIAPISTSLICIEGGSAGRKIAFTLQNVCFVNKLACFNTYENYHSKFIYYSLKGQLFQTQFKNAMTGLIGGVSISALNNFIFTLPPTHEQEAIANFLDEKTAKIDALVQTKQQQIERLKELRQAKIHQAVTKGIPCHAELVEASSKTHALSKDEMKDSGVAWIGEIPAHWEVKKMKSISSKIGDGLHGTPEYDDSGEYYFINGNNLGDNKITIYDSTKLVNKKQFLLNKKPLNRQTILLSINGTIGNVSFYNDENVMLGKSACYINLNKDINKEFISYFLNSKSFKDYYSIVLSGSTIYNLSLHSVANVSFAYPPIQEQEAIVAYLDEVTGKIDQAISQKQEQITKLKEYKQSLINDVVTGKVKVC